MSLVETAMQPAVGAALRIGQMEKHGAARAFDARPIIVAEDYHDVIELVLAPHGLVARAVGQLDRAVVIAVGRIVAPAVIGGRETKRQAGP